eukprot:comp18973_c1_seq1/m.21274 comp18973_c1_seq1/g.21274  ORF comp18973_c1_seq1/g.21274 comp18973_c1_seq1/m.21274 type:complete len:413 (-) comp18973_c1_seq1:285-1523(-)
MALDPEVARAKRLEEDYRIWKKNAPALYDVIFTHDLTWPSLTCQWMCDKTDDPDRDHVEYRLLLGTHTSEIEGGVLEPNHLMIAHMRFPRQRPNMEAPKVDEKGDFGGFGAGHGKFEIYQRITHQGEINRARLMPQNQHIIATRGPHSDVCVFDYTKLPLKPEDTCNPTFRLKGHEKDGYGISWNQQQMGLLASSSDDMTVCVWNITQGGKNNNELDALCRYHYHEDIVEDVSWNPKVSYLFASVSDDRSIALWDYRQPERPAYARKGAHTGPVNCVSWNPFAEHIFITGSGDKTVALWDMRHFKNPMHSFAHHTDEIFQAAWSPHFETVFASGGNDHHIMLWDLSLIGKDQTPDQAMDGPPELLFIHGGHSARVTDLSFNPHDPWLLASTDEYNVLHCWKPAAAIVGEVEE